MAIKKLDVVTCDVKGCMARQEVAPPDYSPLADWGMVGKGAEIINVCPKHFPVLTWDSRVKKLAGALS